MDVHPNRASIASNVDDWLARFSSVAGSRPVAFPFASHKIQSIEARRARMSDLLVFDVLLIRGGIRSPDVLFPPADWAALRELLDAIDESAYDILKKDCLVYILLKWAWDMDPKESNPGWDTRYLQDRCIAPQFVALADAYWLLDTGTHLAKAVSILSDARLNRDYVSKILQALALSSSSISSASGTSPATAALVVKYVRTAKPLLTEPDDIDLYALSLVQLSFMDAWAYQKSFPEGSNTRERLLRKIVGWCLLPTPKQEPLSKLLAFPLSSYELSFLHTLALPSHFLSSSSLASINAATPLDTVLSSQAISVLQDLLCVRAVQSGDYVYAIKLDRQFFSISSSLASGASVSSISSQTTLGNRDTVDRKSVIQDLFATLPPAERTLLEDEIGKVATGVRASASSPSMQRHGTSAAKGSLMTEQGLSASWEDVGASAGSPTLSASISFSPSIIGAGFAGRATPVLISTTNKVKQSPASPFATQVLRPQTATSHRAPPTPKFTAFGSPVPSTTGVSIGKGVISERGKTLFSASAVGVPSSAVKPVTPVSLFRTAGSAKTAPNAFYKPPPAPVARASFDVESALASMGKSTGQGISTETQNGRLQRGESDREDASMGSSSDVEIIEGDHRDGSTGEEQDGDDTGNFLTYDKNSDADLTLHAHYVDEVMSEVHGTGPELGFSVFSGSRNAAQNSSAGEHGKKDTGRSRHAPYVAPPPRARVEPFGEGDKSLSMGIHSTMMNRPRAPPGAFHHEEEDDGDRLGQRERNEDDKERDEEDDQTSPMIPIGSPHRSTQTRMRAWAPPQPPAFPQIQHSSKSTVPTSGASRLSTRSGAAYPGRPSLNQTIPGALMDEDNDVHGQDDTDHMDAHGDGDTEMDEQEEEDDAIAPLPSRSSRRTRSTGSVGGSATTSAKPKPSAKAMASARAIATSTVTAKGKAKARPSEVKTPPRRSSRLSTASSVSPDYSEAASPTKKGRKSTGLKTSVIGTGSATAATRSSARRKR